MLYTNITALSLIEQELLPIEVLHCGNRNFRRFWLLWPWPWPDNLPIRTRPVVRGDIPHVQLWTSYVEAFESYRRTDIHTHIQTYRHGQNYIPGRFAGGQQRQNCDRTLLARHWSRLRKWRQSSDGQRTVLWAWHGRSQVQTTTAAYDIRRIHVSRSSHSTDSMKLRTWVKVQPRVHR